MRQGPISIRIVQRIAAEEKIAILSTTLKFAKILQYHQEVEYLAKQLLKYTIVSFNKGSLQQKVVLQAYNELLKAQGVNEHYKRSLKTFKHLTSDELKNKTIEISTQSTEKVVKNKTSVLETETHDISAKDFETESIDDSAIKDCPNDTFESTKII